jgi:hypothetical protein
MKDRWPAIAVIVALALASGCAARPHAAPSAPTTATRPRWPTATGATATAIAVRTAKLQESLGIGMTVAGNGRILAKGVVGRYPTHGWGTRATGRNAVAWVLFSGLGNETSGPAVLIVLSNPLYPESYARPTNRPDPRLVSREGKLVTVEGRVTATGAMDWVGVRQASPASQRAAAGLGSIAYPGSWWTSWDPAYLELWEWEAAERNMGGTGAAKKDLAFDPAVPETQAVGSVLGAFVDHRSPRASRSMTVVYSTALIFSASPTMTASASLTPSYVAKLPKGPQPPFPRAVDVGGHPGVMKGAGKLAAQIIWRDDQAAYSLAYDGEAAKAPSPVALLEIARSAYR